MAKKSNEFEVSAVAPGKTTLVEVDDEDVAVFNVGGSLYATQAACTHAEGPLNEGVLEGTCITCPWHDSQFDVITGQVLRGPAKQPLKTYRVTISNGTGIVEE